MYNSCQPTTENVTATLYSYSDVSLEVYMDFYLAMQPWNKFHRSIAAAMIALAIGVYTGLKSHDSNCAQDNTIC